MTTKYHPAVMRACRLILADLKKLAAKPTTEIKKWSNLGLTTHCRACRAIAKVSHCMTWDADCKLCPLNALESSSRRAGCIHLVGYNHLYDIVRYRVMANEAEITDAANRMHATISTLLESL